MHPTRFHRKDSVILVVRKAYDYALDALDCSVYLPTLGFKEVPVKGDYVPMAGDIVVMQSTGKHVHGHIQMYNGEKWVSDYTQKNFWPYIVSRPTYQVFR